MHGCETSAIPFVNVRAMLEENVDRDGIALVSSPHERSMTLRVGRIESFWRAEGGLLQHEDERHDGTRVGSEMKCVEALRVGDGRIGAAVAQELHDVDVTVSSCPLQGTCNKITSQRIDFGSVIKQVSAGCKLSIDSRPMQRCDVVIVSVVHSCSS